MNTLLHPMLAVSLAALVCASDGNGQIVTSRPVTTNAVSVSFFAPVLAIANVTVGQPVLIQFLDKLPFAGWQDLRELIIWNPVTQIADTSYVTNRQYRVISITNTGTAVAWKGKIKR